MTYIFRKDFPPTGYKKGDEWQKYPPSGKNLEFHFETAILLSLGIIEEVKEVKEEKWKPGFGEEYWYPDLLVCEARIAIWDGSMKIEEEAYKSGFVLRTKSEAEATLEKIKEVLKKKV